MVAVGEDGDEIDDVHRLHKEECIASSSRGWRGLRRFYGGVPSYASREASAETVAEV